jgi:hypothetical protein
MQEIMTWDYLKRPISQSDIKDLENELGFKLPNEYIKILLHFHGARPSKKRFDTQRTKGRMIKTFLPITEDYKINLIQVKQWLQLSDIMVPFANTPSGDYICFEYFSHEGSPAIVLWNHEERRKEFIKITFIKFINSLY